MVAPISTSLAAAADGPPELVRGRHQGAGPEEDDDMVRLIFTCCHPAIDPTLQVPLTLRIEGSGRGRAAAREHVGVAHRG